MAKNEVKFWWWFLAVALVYTGVFLATRAASHQTVEWRRVLMDGHRAAAKPVNLTNVDEALGVFTDDAYVSPAGVSYPADSPIAGVALALVDAQHSLAPLKVVVGHSDAMYDNPRTDPDLPLANMFVDALRAYGSRYFKVPMDFAITNFGGIRVPLPEGAITLDDIGSMFPFKNYMCYVRMKGSNLLRLLEQLAGTKAFQPVSGVQVRVKNHQLESALIGGKPIDPQRVYNVTTIDFLLDGGDKINIGALALDVKLSHVLLKDIMLDYVQGCEARGEVIHAAADGRVIMEED